MSGCHCLAKILWWKSTARISLMSDSPSRHRHGDCTDTVPSSSSVMSDSSEHGHWWLWLVTRANGQKADAASPFIRAVLIELSCSRSLRLVPPSTDSELPSAGVTVTAVPARYSLARPPGLTAAGQPASDGHGHGYSHVTRQAGLLRTLPPAATLQLFNFELADVPTVRQCQSQCPGPAPSANQDIALLTRIAISYNVTKYLKT